MARYQLCIIIIIIIMVHLTWGYIDRAAKRFDVES